MITPYRDDGHLTSRQKFFNKKLSSRIVIVHSFGILKQRFRQLYYCKLRGMKKICHFIRACVVLHNLCNNDEILSEIDFDDIIIEEDANENHIRHDQEQGFNRRNILCEEVSNYFNQ